MSNASFETVAYRLRPSLEHLDSLPEPMEREYGEVEDFDALIYKPTAPEGTDGSLLDRNVPYRGPEPLNWLGFLNRLHQTDLLNDDLLWPSMSKRILYVLHSVGNFPHKVIPMRIFDYSLEDRVGQYIRQNHFPPEVCNQDYVVLQLLDFTDAVDAELSEYKQYGPSDMFPPSIIRMVLREPVGGFPPVFCIPQEFRYNLFVSRQAKQALEDAGIRGLEFLPQEGVRAENLTAS
jgi:hypothetical protein